ncbi:RICIN domain-containing protein [Micromonospora sp. RL09-050-HVF-A]|uniref:RICIN domain-containing protein n=1 Tax=Micromonospora sp. RL09-050-HVF-A TaxID=1703433 RepID=UPI001C5D3202|nr:RICIN domain-containing protein [Micromonospora sp. RL09-050-HVF-A]MBW4705030.1 RICIN domain-containing protein [Micromonospora sp. RL09-050-HVF-A]
MAVPDPHRDPSGTVYGARRAARPGLPRDPLMRFALAAGLAGVLLGVFFATGVLGGGDGQTQPVVPAAAAPTPAAPTPASPATAAPETSAPPATTPPPSPTPPPTTPATFSGPTVLRAVTSGLCVGTDGAGETATAELAPCTGGAEQSWVANPVAPDLVTLTNAGHGQCLDVEGGSGDDGARIQQFGCHGQANQQWRLTPVGTGPVLLVGVQSGKCVQVRNDGTAAGDDLVQATCTASAGQQWALG